MEPVETEVRRIVHTRVRDALLALTRDGPRDLRLATIATHAAVDPAAAEQILTELEDAGPFEIEPQDSDGEPRWRVR